jgi:hypothetical protein
MHKPEVSFAFNLIEKKVKLYARISCPESYSIGKEKDDFESSTYRE